MNDDTAFEAEIRAMLGRRDPGSTPSHLGAAVVERIGLEGRRSRLTARTRPLVNTVAGLAAVVVVTVIVLGRPIGPGSSPGVSPAPSTVPALVAGDGVVAAPGAPLLQLLLAAGVVIGIGVLAARASRRIVGYAAVTAILGIVWVGSMIGTSDALRGGSGGFGVDPFMERPSSFSDGMFVRADGDVEFRILFGVVNDSRLPLDIVGLAPDQANLQDTTDTPRLLALGYLPDDDCCLPERARPLSRMSLQPGDLVQLVVLGRAGRCATTREPSTGAMLYESINLVYEQLTILHTEAVRLTDAVSIQNSGVC